MMVLICGCVEVHPCPPSVTCLRCNQIFDRQSRLNTQVTNATNESCDRCGEAFCIRSLLEQHRRTIHSGDGAGSDITNNIDTPILSDTGHTQTSSYQEMVDDNYSKICNRTTNTKTKKVINEQLTPAFTYGDLKHLLMGIRRAEANTFKINIGFGSMLFDMVNEVYRYFYVSSNHLLFE